MTGELQELRCAGCYDLIGYRPATTNEFGRLVFCSKVCAREGMVTSLQDRLSHWERLRYTGLSGNKIAKLYGFNVGYVNRLFHGRSR